MSKMNNYYYSLIIQRTSLCLQRHLYHAGEASLSRSKLMDLLLVFECHDALLSRSYFIVVHRIPLFFPHHGAQNCLVLRCGHDLLILCHMNLSSVNNDLNSD